MEVIEILGNTVTTKSGEDEDYINYICDVNSEVYYFSFLADFIKSDFTNSCISC